MELNNNIQGANEAIDEIIRSIIYLINDNMNNNVTKIYSGIIMSNNNDGRWNIQYNGEIHPIKPYGSITPTVGATVKVFLPQNNQALSFFM